MTIVWWEGIMSPPPTAFHCRHWWEGRDLQLLGFQRSSWQRPFPYPGRRRTDIFISYIHNNIATVVTQTLGQTQTQEFTGQGRAEAISWISGQGSDVDW